MTGQIEVLRGDGQEPPTPTLTAMHEAAVRVEAARTLLADALLGLVDLQEAVEGALGPLDRAEQWKEPA